MAYSSKQMSINVLVYDNSSLSLSKCNCSSTDIYRVDCIKNPRGVAFYKTGHYLEPNM